MLKLNLAPTMTTRRVVEIRWRPRTNAEWTVFTTARMEAARLWNTMTAMHAVVRRWSAPWPDLARWNAWARGRFPALSAQTVQQIVGEFCEAIRSATQARRAQLRDVVEVTARYPWRTKARYRDVPYTNQEAVIRNGVLRLPHGSGGNAALYITLPVDRPLPGRLMEATLGYGVVRLVCEVVVPRTQRNGPLVGVDLGVNTLIAATDGKVAVLVNGREAKAIVRYGNKANAALRSRIDRCKRGSKRRKRLVRARYRMADKGARKLRDVLHKATRAVADTFPSSPIVVGKPFNDAARKMGQRQAQQVSQASTARLIAQLAYKTCGATEVAEHYSSQTCPVCGCRQTCRRVYRCKDCGFTAPRDVVGAVNIRAIGLYGELRPDQPIPTTIRFVRPLRKYSGPTARATGPDSPGGTPARVAA